MAEKIIVQYELDTKNFRTQVNEINKGLDNTEKEAKEAGKATENAFNKGGQSAKRASGEIKQADKSIDSMKGNAMKLAGALGLAFSVGAIINFAKSSVSAAAEQLKQEGLLLAALKGREDVQQRLVKQAAEIQSRTVYGDEVIIQQQTFLANQGRTEQQINKTIEAAVQLSAVTGDDLATSVQKLDQTYEGSLGRLGKLDSGFTKLTKAQLANGGAIDLIIQKYSGFAEAQAQTLDGKLKQLSNTFGDIQEEIGKGFIPIIDKVVKSLQQGAAATDFTKIISVISKAIKDIYEPTISFNDALSDLFNVFNTGKDSTEKVIGVIDLLEAAFKILLLPTTLTQKLVTNLVKNVTELVKWFKETSNEGGILGTVLDKVGKGFKFVANGVAELLGLNDRADGSFKKVGTTAVQTALNINKVEDAIVSMGDAKPISALEAVQKEMGELNKRIAEQILLTGKASQEDINRLTFLTGKLGAVQDKLKTINELSKPIDIKFDTVGITNLNEEVINSTTLLQELAKDSGAYLNETVKLIGDTTKKTFEEQVASAQEAIGVIAQGVSEIANIVGQIQERQRQEIDRTYDAQVAAIEKSTLSEEQKEKKIAALRKKQALELYELQKKQFEVNKAIAIVQAIINTAAGVVAQFQAGPAGIALAAIVAAAGIAQIALIASQQPPAPPAFAKGTEFVQRGNNKPGIDTIPAYLNEGEAVIPTDQNRKYPGLSKAWISGNLDDYIVRQFVAPKIAEIERKAEDKWMQKFTANFSGEKFDDMNLLRATTEGNMYLRTIAKEIKNRPQKRMVN
jgi:hypothetical protein